MKLGIDFGTTRTVVTAMDHGNYPVVSFENEEGDLLDYYPSLVAVRDKEVRYGFAALATCDDPDWCLIRSVKSYLKNIKDHPSITIGGQSYMINDLIVGLLKNLKYSLTECSNIDIDADSLLVSIAVPAATNNTQRFYTLEAFRKAGFEVVNMLNEPSAVTVEYTNSFFKKVERSSKQYVLVYDMGGGTFDVSIAEIQDRYHHIVATDGIADLGGDKFDEIMANMTKEQIKTETLDYAKEAQLLALCKQQKENLTPHSKIITIDWEDNNGKTTAIRLSVKDYYLRCQPLVQQTIELLRQLIENSILKAKLDELSAIYVVGGMANFPLIRRSLKQNFGTNRIRKSHRCVSSVAVGMSTLMDQEQQCVIEETLTRYFGLWRETNRGHNLVFDPVFYKNQPLPAKQEEKIIFHRKYRPAHNIGVFRFQECSRLEQNNRPGGLITVWNQVNFPFDPNLALDKLDQTQVVRYPSPLEFNVEEIYTLNAKGEIAVQLINHRTNYQKVIQLFPTTE